MMGKCGRVEGYADCYPVYSFDYAKELGCDNRAARCAGWEKAKHRIPMSDWGYCYDDRCKDEGKQWSFKEGNGDEYYYYPDQRRCRSYVNGSWD